MRNCFEGRSISSKTRRLNCPSDSRWNLKWSGHATQPNPLDCYHPARMTRRNFERCLTLACNSVKFWGLSETHGRLRLDSPTSSHQKTGTPRPALVPPSLQRREQGVPSEAE